MPAARIDFKYVKQQADFLAVLSHYGFEPTGSGVSRAIRCPFHPDKKPSLKVNLGRKGFHCFGCSAKGNVLSFVQRMEGLPENDLRGAARALAAICNIPMTPSGGTPEAAQKPAERETAQRR